MRVAARNRRKAGLRLLGTMALTAGLIAGTAVAAPLASADPDAVEAAKKRVEELQTEANAIDQDALEAQEKLDKAREALKNRESDEAGQQRKVEDLKAQLRALALAQYQDRALDPSTRVLFSSDGDTFINRFATVQHVTDSQNGLLQEFQAQEASLATMKRDSEADVKTIAEQERKVSDLQKQSKQKVADAEAVLNRLTEEERQRLQREEERRQQEEAAAANADSDSDSDSSSGSTRSGSGSSGSSSKTSSSGNSDPTAGIPDSDRVAKVLATAKAQLGKPYVYAATGPDSFDCSGFTSYAFKAAGVSLPRVSRAQAGAGKRVSRSDLKPGDLVFYYSPISHVAIYVGNGKIIHSPRPGKTVSYAPVDQMPFNTAARVL